MAVFASRLPPDNPIVMAVVKLARAFDHPSDAVWVVVQDWHDHGRLIIQAVASNDQLFSREFGFATPITPHELRQRALLEARDLLIDVSNYEMQQAKNAADLLAE
jgi:hypothetical protein